MNQRTSDLLLYFLFIDTDLLDGEGKSASTVQLSCANKYFSFFHSAKSFKIILCRSTFAILSIANAGKLEFPTQIIVCESLVASDWSMCALILNIVSASPGSPRG